MGSGEFGSPPGTPTVETLALIVTRACDLRCTYCAASKRDDDLDPEVALRTVDSFTAAGGGRIRLTGGEPTLRWDTVELILGRVAALRHRGHELDIELCTNGRSLDGTRLAALDQPWVRVVVSVDGAPPVQRASGRTTIAALDTLLRRPTTTVTQTLSPELVPHALDGFLHLWERGARRFNLLPVYYTRWSAGALRDLEEALAGIGEFVGPRIRGGHADLRNLHRRGAVPLFADDLTLDTDGAVYRTNLVLADRFTAPLLPSLRSDVTAPLPIPPDLGSRLDALLPAPVRSSNRAVDRVLTAFVDRLREPARVGPRVAPTRPRRPPRLEFHLSYACDNRCEFCSEDDRLARWRDVPVTAREVRRVLHSHARAGGDHLLLTGGEPTLHPVFPYTVELAQRLGFRVAVGTNGARLCDPPFASRVLPLLAELSLSIHGADAATHDASTRRAGSFEQLMATRSNAARLTPALAVAANTVVTARNAGQLEEVVTLCAEQGIGRLLVSSVAPEGAALRSYGTLAVPLARWRALAPRLVAAGDAQGVRLRFFGLPLCALGAVRTRSNDLYYDARATVERARGTRGSVRLSHVITRHPRRGRRWTRRCRGCRYREVCGGVFRAYVERFGDHEIEPITG